MARVMATVTATVVTVARTIAVIIMQTGAIAEAAEVSSTIVYRPSRKPCSALPQNKGAGSHGHQGMVLTPRVPLIYGCLIWEHRSLTWKTLILTTSCGSCLTCVLLLLCDSHSSLRTQPCAPQCLVVSVTVAKAMRGKSVVDTGQAPRVSNILGLKSGESWHLRHWICNSSYCQRLGNTNFLGLHNICHLILRVPMPESCT